MEGIKERDMQTTTASASTAGIAAEGRRAKTLPLIFAALFGIFIIGFVGLVPIAEVHNAGHDYRHSMGFPCH